MAPIGYNLSVNDQGDGQVTFVNADGVLETIQSDHPRFALLAHALISGEDPEQYLPSVTALSDRVSIDDDNVVRFDGEVLHSSVTDAIERYVSEGRDAQAIVKFLERVQANPSERARGELYDWVQHQGLTIDGDGWIVAHKSVHIVRDADPNKVFQTVRRNLSAKKVLEALSGEDGANLYRSSSGGQAAVDGIKFTGYIPNYVGAVVTMPRDEVDPSTDVDCSRGLHIGTFNYAHGFAGDTIIEVKVDPADVVSVPRYDTTKLRCCRYEVVAVQDKPQRDLSHYEPVATREVDLEDALSEKTEIPKGFIARLRARRATRKGDA